MERENKICQSCHKQFTIEPEDFNFYKKINVPAPTWCPKCRLERRICFINNWDIYWRDCDKCGEKTMSMYSLDQNMAVYCLSCWWKDDWDGTEYAMEYDSKRSFLEQVKELSDKTPFMALNNLFTSLKNCNYSNGIAWSKDCYLTFWADYCDNVYHSSMLNGLKYSSDCLRGFHSELCYGSMGFSRCYRMFFSDECDDCVDVWFSRNCYGCTNCVGCVNLSGASNCIFNIKYSKKDYAEKIKELKLESWKNLDELQKKAQEFWQTLPYREYHGHSLNKNVSGEYVYTSKNSKESYIINGAENCKYCQFISVPPAKDCMDFSGWGDGVELAYESSSMGVNINSVKFCFDSYPDTLNLEYCFWNISCKNNFGCVNLKRKEYCILNKEYSKEEFTKLKEKIIADMKINPYVDKLGRKFFYGEFFPPEMSKFSYNKSNATKFLPKTKEEALSQGYNWIDEGDSFHEASILDDSLPDSILETKENILNEIIKCKDCGKGYKIASGEFDLLRKMGLPIPHICPKCRENERFVRLNKPGLYNRNCAKCNVEIRTPYAPERSEIIYCEKCYQQEVY